MLPITENWWWSFSPTLSTYPLLIAHGGVIASCYDECEAYNVDGSDFAGQASWKTVQFAVVVVIINWYIILYAYIVWSVSLFLDITFNTSKT